MNIQQFLEKQDVGYDVIEHRPTYDAQRMAQAVHVSGYEVAKTVLLRCDHDFAYTVAVLPATHHIDLGKVSAAMNGAQIELATEIEISQHCPDCEFGALPPFGSQYGMTTIVDESLTQDEEIVFEGNTHHEAVRMKTEDFRRIESPLVVPFARRP